MCELVGKDLKIVKKEISSTPEEIKQWSANVKDSDTFERWMGELPPFLRFIPIFDLAIPGSHDSMSFGISKGSGISPDASLLLRAVGKCLGLLVKPLLFKWCVTQHTSTSGQLIAGIRYFDLRIAVHKSNDIFQFVHGMYAQEVTEPLMSIREFLLSHEEEVVILDIQHFYDFSADNHQQFQTLLLKIFGSMACPVPKNGDLSCVTLHHLGAHRYQIIIIYRSDVEQSNTQLWPTTLWPTPWPKTTSVHKLRQFLKTGIQNRPINTGYVSQCVLTPDTWFLMLHPFSNLFKKCAAPCNYAIIPWLEQQFPGPKGINVVIADYFDFDPVKFPYVKTIVLLNRKLAQPEIED